jgi:hypothetical protein
MSKVWGVLSLSTVEAIKALEDYVLGTKKATEATKEELNVVGSGPGIIGSFIQLINRMALAQSRVDFRQANNQLDTYREKLTDARIAGAGLGTQLGILAKEEIKARQAVTAAEHGVEATGGRSKSALEARRKAKDALLGILEEERRIRQDIAQQAKDLADDIERALDEAAQQLADQIAKADQAFIDTITRKQSAANIGQVVAQGTAGLGDDISAMRAYESQLQVWIGQASRTISDEGQRADFVLQLTTELAQTRNAINSALQQEFESQLATAQGKSQLAIVIAEGTTTLKDDIAAYRQQRAVILAWIAATAARIKDEQLRNEILLRLRTELAQTTNSIKDLQARQREQAKQQAEARQQAIQDRRDREQESRELDVQIAEVGGNKRKEIQAHQALMNYLIQRREHTSRGSVEWKRLTLQIEQERKAIADLRHAQDERRKEMAAANFEFLRTQQGFAATLLGNLLPTSAVAGTVGGGAVATPTTGLRDASTTAAGAPRGPTGSQMSALIDVQRQSLRFLRRLAGQNEIPSTTHHRAVDDATMAHGGV